MTSAATCRASFTWSDVYSGDPPELAEFPMGSRRDLTTRNSTDLSVGASMSGVVSFLSSNERDGRWQLPRKFRALAVLGSVELDLRDADIGYGLSTIECVAVLGNIEITVPPEISVDCDGDSLLGTFTLKYNKRVSPA